MFYSMNIILLVALFADSTGPVRSCSVYEYGLTKDEENFIVNKHNELRTLIAQGKVENQPRGVNLKRIKYSPVLAQKAQEIANTCVYGHADIKGTQWKWVGQNLFHAQRTDFIKGADWDAAINSWWNERKVYKFGGPYTKQVVHYTQMVWANTEYVGCGYSHYPADGPYKYERFYICNYGPGYIKSDHTIGKSIEFVTRRGNFPGQDPYEVGNSGCDNLC